MAKRGELIPMSEQQMIDCGQGGCNEGFSQRECLGRGCGFDWLPCLCCCCCWFFLPALQWRHLQCPLLPVQPTQPRRSMCRIPAWISLHREELLGWKLGREWLHPDEAGGELLWHCQRPHVRHPQLNVTAARHPRPNLDAFSLK